MAQSVSESWEQIAASGDFNRLDALLAEEVVFESPVVHTPQVGREITKAYLIAAVQLLKTSEFRFVKRWFAERSAVLEFETQLDGLTINGVDMISWDSQDRITHFKVMVRPLKAINALHLAMARQLAAAGAKA